MRPDHQAVLDLLAAFDIPHHPEWLQAVEITAQWGEPTFVTVRHFTVDATPGAVDRHYEVTAKEIT